MLLGSMNLTTKLRELNAEGGLDISSINSGYYKQ